MRKETIAQFIRAHLYGGLVIGIILVLFPLLLKPLDDYMPLMLPGFLRYVGIPVFLVGVALMYASFWILVTRGGATTIPTNPPKQLLIAGPYRYVRNPMYIGDFIVLLGAALYFSSPIILLYTAALCLVAHFYVTSFEEPELQRRYGEFYEEYKMKVPRWIPRL
jgi:protein-S-isoprenylcysteine O-methyltransferase Ste14